MEQHRSVVGDDLGDEVKRFGRCGDRSQVASLLYFTHQSGECLVGFAQIELFHRVRVALRCWPRDGEIHSPKKSLTMPLEAGSAAFRLWLRDRTLRARRADMDTRSIRRLDYAAATQSWTACFVALTKPVPAIHPIEPIADGLPGLLIF